MGFYMVIFVYANIIYMIFCMTIFFTLQFFTRQYFFTRQFFLHGSFFHGGVFLHCTVFTRQSPGFVYTCVLHASVIFYSSRFFCMQVFFLHGSISFYMAVFLHSSIFLLDSLLGNMFFHSLQYLFYRTIVLPDLFLPCNNFFTWQCFFVADFQRLTTSMPALCDFPLVPLNISDE